MNKFYNIKKSFIQKKKYIDIFSKNNNKRFNEYKIYTIINLNELKNNNSDNSLKKIISKNNKIKRKLNINTYISFIVFNFIVINLISIILAEDFFNDHENMNQQNKPNIIYLKLNKKGYNHIFSSEYFPDEVYLNNNTRTNINEEGDIFVRGRQKENYVTMIWNQRINNLNHLFSSSEIIEIDLSNFNTSTVTSMKNMFYNCSNLISINFGNIDTSSVTDMSSMFYNCTNIKSINLSNFDTSKVINMNRMFYKCFSLKSLNLTNFNTSKVTTMEYMFYNLRGITNIYLSKLDTSNVINMDHLFDSCFSLVSLNLNNFNTSKVTSMKGMFNLCMSLKSIDLSNLDTSNVINMEEMFQSCYSLISLDLSNFNTSSVQSMNYMFYEDYGLVKLNLSGFKTNNVYEMKYMFNYCFDLISLDLSSFSFNQVNLSSIFSDCHSLTSIKFPKENKLVSNISYMFYNCISLKTIDLYNFDFSMIEDMSRIFANCYSLTTIINLSEIDTFSVTNMEFMFYGCNSLTSVNFEKWITSSVKSLQSMFYDCTSLLSIDLKNFDTSLVENMKELFYNCIKLTSINLKNFDTSLVTDMESMFYGCSSLLSLNLSSFDTSNVNTMKLMFYNCIQLTSLNLSNFNTEKVTKMDFMFYGCLNLSYINLFSFNDKSLNLITNLFVRIADNSVICINNISKESNKNKIREELSKLKCPIIDCSNNWKEKRKRIIYYNGTCIDNCQNDKINKYEYEYYCYDSCPKGTHSLKSNQYLCEKNQDKCNQKFPYINLEDNSCAEFCSSEDFFNEKCILNNHTIEQKDIHVKNIIKDIQNNLINNNLLNEIIEEHNDIIIKDNNTIYQLTTSFNQNNNSYENISTIKLGECERILKQKYNISNEETLLIFKIEEKIEGLLIPLIEYEIFNPITKQKLDLSPCKEEDINIDIHIPLSINENLLFKYDQNNNYYYNICNTETTEYEIDITLYDRKNEYNSKNMSLCPNNCIFFNYDSDNLTVICQCEIKDGIVFNVSNLLNAFINEKGIFNLNVLKCIRLIFFKDVLFKNIANYILLLIIIINIILVIHFILKEYKFILEQIKEIAIYKKNETYNNKNIIKEEVANNISSNLVASKNRQKNKNDIKENTTSKINLSNSIIYTHNKNMKDEKMETENHNFYYEYEINNISYEEAKRLDNRNYFQFYLSLIKLNYILSFTFKTNKDYNSYDIKICLFILLITLHMFINTLFFNDYMMHKIYEDKGKFNFLYVLPQIIYSNIICSVVNFILKILVLSQKNVLEIKNEKNNNINAKVLTAIKCIKIKCSCFFVFNFLYLMFLWFYLSCFCFIYKNTQKYLFIVILISCLISLIYQFIIFLLAGILRILALKGTGKCQYKFSQIIHKF